jgi:micrococcal nuclease
MYEYRCTVTRVVDGDTVHADVDLGCDVHLGLTLRLAGIDTPELPTVEGIAAKERLSELLAEGPVILKTIKDRREKYGRYLAILEVAGVSVADRLVLEGFATRT